jgi:uncharacterized membrane protein (UPF0127 family)
VSYATGKTIPTYPVHVGDLTIECIVADHGVDRMIGLQNHMGLSDNEGMYFPYDEEGEPASFHMASVRFPIDIVFAWKNIVVKIVHNIAPGTPGRWGLDRCSGALEVRGGWCKDNDVDVGSFLVLERR